MRKLCFAYSLLALSLAAPQLYDMPRVVEGKIDWLRGCARYSERGLILGEGCASLNRFIQRTFEYEEGKGKEAENRARIRVEDRAEGSAENRVEDRAEDRTKSRTKKDPHKDIPPSTFRYHPSLVAILRASEYAGEYNSRKDWLPRLRGRPMAIDLSDKLPLTFAYKHMGYETHVRLSNLFEDCVVPSLPTPLSEIVDADAASDVLNIIEAVKNKDEDKVTKLMEPHSEESQKIEIPPRALAELLFLVNEAQNHCAVLCNIVRRKARISGTISGNTPPITKEFVMSCSQTLDLELTKESEDSLTPAALDLVENLVRDAVPNIRRSESRSAYGS